MVVCRRFRGRPGERLAFRLGRGRGRRHPVRQWLVRAAALLPLAVVSLVVTGPATAQGATSGSVSGFGTAVAVGSPGAQQLAAPLAGMAPTPDGQGYWLLGADGGVFAYGDAGFFGSAAASGAQVPFVGMAATPDGQGYWLVTTYGGVSAFGDAGQYGQAGTLNAPVVGMAATPDGQGYWLVAADGGVFTYGDAHFYGSMGAAPLNQPVVGMAATPDGGGYWLVAADGGIFSFGDARFYGSMGGSPLNQPVVGMAATPDGQGYWLVAADGGIFSFGAASFLGSLGGDPPGASTPVVATAADPAGGGYWLTTTDRAISPSGPVPAVLATCNLPGSAPAVEPSTIMLACGDGNAYLDHLTWSSWTSSGATGVGTYTHNLCQPDCADGTFVSAPTTVRLGYPIATGRGREFAQLSYTAAGTTRTTVIPTSPG